MKIVIVGTGYVGLVTGTCFAETGNTVTCVDIDAKKVEKLQSGQLTIYEPGLEKIFQRNQKEGRLFFTTSLKEAVDSAKVIMLALPTPPGEDGSADLKYILGVADELGKILTEYKVVVDKSTVPVGTAKLVKEAIAKHATVDFDVVSNPEFLREGVAVDDFMKPDRVIIGTTSDKAIKIMNDLYEAGFQAINMQQMADFMYNNAKIPPRSVLLIVDDRHFAEYFNDHFRPYFNQWGWPVVNGYIGVDERVDLWAENAALSAEGWVDYQSHGYLHNTPIGEGSTDEFITSEMGGAILSIQKYMNKTPIGYIWPGGGFSTRAVAIGTQLGYKLGFTVNPRGPVMYNWVPQADTINDSNPYAIPETPAGNPLMTLPRYWSPDARENIDSVRVIGQEAAEFAEQNKAIELEYYDIVCAPTYGPIPPTP